MTPALADFDHCGRDAQKLDAVQADRLLSLWAHGVGGGDTTPEQFIAAARSLGLWRPRNQETYG